MSQEIGNIKRRYPTDDFNPFKVFDWFTKNKYHLGINSKILVVGFSERFKESIVKGFRDAVRDQGIAPEHVPAIFDFGSYLEATTASGTVVRIMLLQDSGDAHMAFHEQCEWATTLGLCSRYKAPEILNILRDKAPVIDVLDFSQNNLKKDVDTEEE